MPSLLGRYLGITSRTERLIMNIFGLVNSTLDWSPIKWSNKLEQIWNLSLSQGTLIFDTVGEDTIKTVLSWIVITRIVIAHLYTFSYMINLYPILTSRRPNLLLPWLILSFFKNVVLEVIVIAVGLLLWYDKRFSLTIFVEFILVKVVPLILFSYMWYSNSCLFLEQRHQEKIRKLKRMRSDTNVIANRLCSKLADSKYRTRSLTTLISCESYETYDSRDTISRIIDDPNLTPAQKTMRILGLTDQDIAEARARIKERAARKKLSEKDDDSLGRAGTKRDVSRYFFEEYDLNVLLKDEQSTRKQSESDEIAIEEDETSMDEDNEDEIAENVREDNEITIADESSASDNVTGESETAEYRVAMDVTANDKNDKNANGTAGEDRVTTDEITSDEIIANNDSTLRNPSTLSRNPSFESVQHSSMKEEAGADFPQTNQYGRSSSTVRDSSSANFSGHARQSVEISNKPVELRSLFGCNCIVDDYLYTKTLDDYCLSSGAMMRNSTPGGSIDEDKMARNAEDDWENSNDTTYHSCLMDNTDHGITGNQTAELPTDNGLPLIQKLLQNDLNILRNIRGDDRKLENSSNDKPISGVDDESSGLSRSYAEQCNASKVDVQSLSDILKDLSVTRNVVTNFETLKIVESNESTADDEMQKTVVSVSVTDGSTVVNTVQRSGRNTERNVVKVSSFGDANIPRFFKDSMKIFDGCYENDFANNTELQCLLRQLEKKKWSIFPAQLGQGPSNVLKEQNDHGNRSSTVQDLRIVGLPNCDNFSTTKTYEITTSTPSKVIYEEHVAPEIMQVDDGFSVALGDARKPKDAHTQTENDDRQEERSRGSNSSLVDEAQKTQRHRKTFFKCKRPKERECEANHRERKTPRDTARASKRLPQIAERSDEKQGKPTENPRNKPESTGSPSDESVCECRGAQSIEPKPDRRREMNRKCTSRCKVETFGTIPFSQVVRPAIFDSVIYRRKPPAYPRWSKNEPANVSSAANSKKATSSTFKTLAAAQDETSKKPEADKQSAVQSSRKFKWNSRAEEKEAVREMRALKAYNEVTLLKDKKALEARKRPTAGRQQLAAVATPESSKTQSRKNRPDRCKRNVHRNVDVDYLDKENLFVDATTETEPLLNVPVKNSKTFVTTNDGRRTLLSCSNKLSKVNRIADKLLLDNLDRLRGGQAKQSANVSKRTGEVETKKKQHTKYSRPKKLTKEQEENDGSMVSMKKFEGTQKGQELERTPGKKDVRGPLDIPAASSDVDSRLLAENVRDKQTSANFCVDFGAQAGRLLTVVKPTTTQDVASSWSFSSVEQEDETYFPEQDDASTQTTEHEATPELEEKRETVKTEDSKKENELASETEELVPMLEIKDQPREAIPKTAGNQNELDPVSQVEEFESAFEEQAKGIDPISGTEERRNETSNIRDDCQKQVEETENEATKESIVSDDVPRNEAKENVEVRVEEDKMEETEGTKVSDDVFPNYLPEYTESETEVLRNERETVQVRGDRDLDVLQNERETISRRLMSNLSDLAGSIDINYVILSSFDAPRESDTPVWDIVDEDTIRTLHNMFAYRSLDASFDLSGEFHTMEEILNGRQTVSSSSSDDFIFQPSINFPTNLSMYEHTALRAMIRHPRRRRLEDEEEEEEDDDDDSLCDLCITAIDREHLPEIGSFEIDGDLLGDEEISAEHPIVSELGLNDFLMQVIRIWRRLNLRGLLTGVLDTLHDPLNDRIDTSQLVLSHEERGDDETHARGCSLDEQRMSKFFEDDCLMRFINEDIFTNIKFPVVINLAAIRDSLGQVAFDDEEDLDVDVDVDVVLEQAEPSKTNLFSLMDDGHEDGDVEIINEIGDDEDEETTRNEHVKTLQLSSMSIVNSYDAFGRTLNEDSEDQISIASRANKLKKYMLVRSEPVHAPRRKNINRANINRLQEIDTTDEELKIAERSIDSEEVDEIIAATEDVEQVEKSRTKDTDESEAIEKIYKYEDVDDDAKEDTKVDETTRVKSEVEEDDSYETSDLEIVSLYTIVTFWMLVFCFYVRYFYQRIFLFKQASTSTSTLKPFEIHAAPTSTATFLDNSMLIDRIAKTTHEETDEDDSFDGIVDLEMIDVSRFDEYDSVMNFDSNLYGTLPNISIVKDLNENDPKETEESAVCLRKRIFGNIDICPNESQDEEMETSAVSVSKIKPIDSEFADSSFAVELRLAAKEIETLRYEQDDDLTSDDETVIESIDDRRDFITKNATTNAEAGKFLEVREDDDEEEKENVCSTVERTSFERAALSRTSAIRDERSSSHANFMETRTNDSFDSTYTAISQVSRNAASAIDLNDSSMEEFAISSNESGESNEGS